MKARNWIDFLTGRGSDKKNFDAHDFLPGYKAPPRSHLQMKINDLDGHVVHLSKKRPTESSKKISLDDCIALSQWIESAMSDFLKGLSPENARHWNHGKANCVPPQLSLTLPKAKPSASSADPSFG